MIDRSQCDCARPAQSSLTAPCAIAIAMASLARASQRSRYSKKRAPPERDWAELHQDLISCILHRLDQAELLIGGVAGVCRSWRRAAREEPELWRRIDLRGGLWFVPPFCREWSLETMVRKALRLGAGQCEAFLCERVNDDILLILAEQAPLLKSLHLISSSVSDQGFEKAIKIMRVFELVARACPLLKHFKHVAGMYFANGNAVAFAAASMHKLRTLHLVGHTFHSEGLVAILDNCHDLEYLNMRECKPIAIDDRLQVKLARINMDDREYKSDNYEDYGYLAGCTYYHPYSPACGYRPCWRSDPELAEVYFDYYMDSLRYDVDDYDTGDDEDLEEYEKILDIKSMCRYLS
ncbi:hypothetical protein VPH35_103314 [Triticum aestivum]